MSSTSLSTDSSGIHLQTQKCRTPVESRQEYLTSRKEYIEPQQNSVGQRNQGEKQECQQDWTCPQPVGKLKQGPIPISGQLYESEEKHLRLRVRQVICGGLNGMRIKQSLQQPYISQTGTQVPWKVQQLGVGDQGLWSNPRVRAAVDCRETDGGKVREETVVESSAAMHSGWSHHHSLSLPTCQHRQLNNREAGPTNI